MYTTAFYISAYIGVVGTDWIDGWTVAAEYDAHLLNGPSSKIERNKNVHTAFSYSRAAGTTRATHTHDVGVHGIPYFT